MSSKMEFLGVSDILDIIAPKALSYREILRFSYLTK